MSILEASPDTDAAESLAAPGSGDAALQAQADRYRQAVEALTAVCRSAAAGDLEPRVPDLGDDPVQTAARDALNEVLDRTDAYVRESSASLEFASEAKFFRRFLVRGMLGSFRAGAGTINSAIDAMATTHAELAHQEVQRRELANAFEEAVLGLSDQVASASTQMEASSRGLAANADRLVEESVAYTRTREQGGKPIAAFQLVQGLVADSVTDLYAGRALVLDVARRFDDGSDLRVGPATAKYFASEMVGRVADRAVQIHGGAGYMRETTVERFYRDARLFRIYEGTSQIQQVIIAREVIGDAVD